MEADIVDLEDGEIVDEIDDDVKHDEYFPLERPTTQQNPPTIPSQIIDEESLEESTSSDSDSDGSHFKMKQRKKSLKLLKKQPPVKRQKNYKIWCNNATEDALANNLIHCNVDSCFDRTRDVESYNYFLPIVQGGGNKRTRCGGLINAHKSVGGNKNYSKNEKEKMRTPRELPLISQTEWESDEALAAEIANKLCEEKDGLILRVITTLGKEMAIKFYEETRELERNGGLLIMNGTRRRTPGGVYFYLVKLKGGKDIPPETMREIFILDKITTRRKLTQDANKTRKAKLREEMVKEDFPTLLTRAELAIKRLKESQRDDDEELDEGRSNEESGGGRTRTEVEEGEREGEEEGAVKNPPPSPATDGRDGSSDGEETKDGNGLGMDVV